MSTDDRRARVDAALAGIVDTVTLATSLDQLTPAQAAYVTRAAAAEGISTEAFLARAARETATPTPGSDDDTAGIAASVRKYR